MTAGGAKAQAARHLVLGTAGHIDHGKSSLVLALTGVDPDRLAEEKQRGITIELGFAELELPDGTRLGVVDVPGHERFVRQMIAGSTGIDLALLCIAVDDGVMPQTVEHEAVLELLGVPSCVVALTKCDLVDDEWIELSQEEVRAFLAGTPYAAAPIVPVSSRTGEGLDELRGALADAARAVTPAHAGDDARMPIDRVFTIKGAGTVVTGTLWAGQVAEGDELAVLPSGITARVRSVQSHGRAVASAPAGTRVALNLNALKTTDVRPGDFLAAPGSVQATDRFDAQLAYLDAGQGGKPLKTGARVHVAHGTREVLGRVLLMDGREQLGPRQSCYAQIRLEEPLPASWRDRFVIRSYSPVRVVGGGTVLAAHPRRRTSLAPEERALLDALLAGDEAAACDAALALEPHPATAARLAEAAGISEAACARRLEELCAKRAVQVVSGGAPAHYASPRVAARDLAAAENALLAFHAQNPLAPGMAKAALVQRAWKRIDPAAADALLAEAAAAGRVVAADGVISHPKAGGGAKRAEEQACEQLARALADAGAAPPAVAALIADSGLDSSLAHRALGALEKQGRIVRAGQDLAFDVQVFAALQEAAAGCLRERGEASAADLKEAMGTTRKYAMPVLELLDARGVTVRDGDVRRLKG